MYDSTPEEQLPLRPISPPESPQQSLAISSLTESPNDTINDTISETDSVDSEPFGLIEDTIFLEYLFGKKQDKDETASSELTYQSQLFVSSTEVSPPVSLKDEDEEDKEIEYANCCPGFQLFGKW